MVHHYLVKDGVDVCKYCGMVRNKDRVGPQYCAGKLPPKTRAEIIDEWKAANGYDDLLKAYLDAVQARNDALSDAHVDGLHRRIDALVAIAEAAEELCRVVGERAADGDFSPLPQASLTGAVREEIAPHVFRQWAAVKAALHRAEVDQ